MIKPTNIKRKKSIENRKARSLSVIKTAKKGSLHPTATTMHIPVPNPERHVFRGMENEYGKEYNTSIGLN